MKCPKCEHDMSLVTVITGSLTWVCPNCGWREKYVESKAIPVVYQGIVDGQHQFAPIVTETDGTIEPKFKTVISYCPHCGGEIKLKIEV